MQSVTNVKDIHSEHASTPVDSIAVLLLNAYIEPDWEQLSKSTKRSLCAKVKVPFNNMNCSTFYEKLHQTWASNKKNTENVLKAKQSRGKRCMLVSVRGCTIFPSNDDLMTAVTVDVTVKVVAKQ